MSEAVTNFSKEMTQFREEWGPRVEKAEEDLDKEADDTKESDEDLDNDALLLYRSTQAPEIEGQVSEQSVQPDSVGTET